MNPILRLLLLLALGYAVYRFLRRPVMPPAPPPRAPQRRPVEDLTECPACHTYVGVSTARCARADCPRGGS
jgi:hypothetical protein